MVKRTGFKQCDFQECVEWSEISVIWSWLYTHLSGKKKKKLILKNNIINKKIKKNQQK